MSNPNRFVLIIPAKISVFQENVDRLSRLPEEIAAHILSLMPTKFAVRTSILSKRWRYTWMFVTNIDIEAILPAIEKVEQIDSLTKFIDRVLKFRKTSRLQLFQLHLLDLWFLSPNITNWIDEAVRLNVCELDIRAERLGLPLSMFTRKTLTILRLDHCDYRPCIWDCPSFVNLPCLNTLDIANFTNPVVDAFKLIRGCPVLESLYLELVWCTGDEDYIFNIPTLRRLKLTWCNGGYGHINKVVLHTPNLEYLFVGGVLFSLFVMKDVLSLVEASLSFSEIRSYYLWFELLKKINGVKSLSAQNERSLDCFKFPFTSPLPILPHMKNLELKGFWHPLLIAQFLESSPELKHLCIGKTFSWFQYDQNCTEFSWVEPKVIPGCILTNITTIKFSICEWEECDMEFLEYMLGNAEVLKTVTITWDYATKEEETWLYSKLLTIHWASRCCEPHYHGNRFSSSS